MSLYETIGTNNPAYLLAKAEGAETIAVDMVPGNGTVKRGTVIYKADSGMWAPAAANNVTANAQLAVLDETIDTTGVTSGNKVIAAAARAYISGYFVKGKVTLASDAAVAAAKAVILRAQGIVLLPMVGTSSFDNRADAPQNEAAGG